MDIIELWRESGRAVIAAGRDVERVMEDHVLVRVPGDDRLHQINSVDHDGINIVLVVE